MNDEHEKLVQSIALDIASGVSGLQRDDEEVLSVLPAYVDDVLDVIRFAGTRGFAFVKLPDSLSRDQAEPLCKLEGTCARSGGCCGDCECSEPVQVAWRELASRLEAVRIGDDDG